jgi:hypothetical protein
MAKHLVDIADFDLIAETTGERCDRVVRAGSIP